jgi:hypothetical protein
MVQLTMGFFGGRQPQLYFPVNLSGGDSLQTEVVTARGTPVIICGYTRAAGKAGVKDTALLTERAVQVRCFGTE